MNQNKIAPLSFREENQDAKNPGASAMADRERI